MVRHFLTVASAVLVATLPQSHGAGITVNEASGGAYEACTDEELAPFSAQIMAESDDCVTKASYNWNNVDVPSAIERKELCACTPLIQKLQTVTVPHCGLLRISTTEGTGGLYSYKALMEFAFGLCDVGKSSPGVAPTTAPTGTATTKPPTAKPTPPIIYNPGETTAPISLSPPIMTSAPIASSSPSLVATPVPSATSSAASYKSYAGVLVGTIMGVLVVAGRV